MSHTPEWPKVSVVVPTRDRPDFLRRAVWAILGQRYPGSVECVVVFDQSEPAPIDVPVGPDREMRSIVNDRTPGLAGARNAGVLASTGFLLAFCDDDDEWLPDKLTKQVEALRAGWGAIAIACGIHVINGSRTMTRVLSESVVTFEQLLRSRLMEVNPCTILLERKTFLRIGLVDEDIPGSYYEDYEWLLRCTREGPIHVLPEPLVRINWHGTSFFVERWRTIVAALEYILDKYPEFASDRVGLARLHGQLAFANAACGQVRAALRWARSAVMLDWRERRAYLALAVSARLIKPDTVLRAARARGKGI